MTNDAVVKQMYWMFICKIIIGKMCWTWVINLPRRAVENIKGPQNKTRYFLMITFVKQHMV